MNGETGLHTVRIALYRSTLATAQDSEYTGRITPRGRVNLEDLARDIAEQGSEIHEAILVSAAKQIAEAALARIREGFSVDMGICRLRMGVSGSFEKKNPCFDPQKNKLTILCTPSKEAVEALRFVKVQAAESAITGPVITAVENCSPGMPPNSIRAEKLIKIRGKRLKIAGSHPDNGVWFIREGTRKKIRADMRDIALNNPALIELIVPPLDEGPWQLEIVTQYLHASNLTKEPRTYRFEGLLNVAH